MKNSGLKILVKKAKLAMGTLFKPAEPLPIILEDKMLAEIVRYTA
jgi:hypothetical protein